MTPEGSRLEFLEQTTDHIGISSSQFLFHSVVELRWALGQLKEEAKKIEKCNKAALTTAISQKLKRILKSLL